MSYAIRNNTLIGSSTTKTADNKSIIDVGDILSTAIGGGLNITYDGIDMAKAVVPEGYTSGNITLSKSMPTFDIDENKIVYVRARRPDGLTKVFKFEQTIKINNNTAYYGRTSSSPKDIQSLAELEKWIGNANSSQGDSISITTNNSKELTSIAIIGANVWHTCELEFKTGIPIPINPNFIPTDETTIAVREGKLSVLNPVADHEAVSPVPEGYYLSPDTGDINNKWELASRDVLEGGIEEKKGKLVTVGAIWNALGGEPVHKLKTKATAVTDAINELSEGLSIISLREEDLH